MKIVITDAKTVTNGDLDLSVFEQFGELSIYQLTPPEELKNRLSDADAVLLNKTVLNEEILKDAPNLKYIGLFATGYNNIDTEYCKAHGITVCNAGSYSTDAVAQTVFAFILNHANKISDYRKFVEEGGWQNAPTFSPFVFPTFELTGKKLGIVGYGSIGKRVAELGKAFGMEIIPVGHDLKGFSEMLKEADFVTCHCPLNAESTGLFNRDTFAQMKDGAFFINTARGGVVSEEDLRDALNSGKLSGAGIDVLTEEPMSRDCVLMQAKNITFTPHVGWAPYETRVRLLKIVADNLGNFISGTPTNVIV